MCRVYTVNKLICSPVSFADDITEGAVGVDEELVEDEDVADAQTDALTVEVTKVGNNNTDCDVSTACKLTDGV